MDELTIGEKTYISSKRAAKVTGYAKDYIGQLCREGRVEARLVGRNWYVLESSITEHRFGAAQKEDEGKKEVVGHGVAPEPISWSKPTYEPEKPVHIPPLLPKDPDTVSSRRVVSEMQDAWQEWFKSQGSQESVLIDDGAEAFDGSLLPALSNTEEEVHISKIESLPEEPATLEILEEEQIVPVHAVRYTDAPRTQPTEIMDLSARLTIAAESVPTHSETPEKVGSSLVLKTILLGLAFVSLCVALVGTGMVEEFAGSSYDARSPQGQVVKFLAGESEYQNSK